MERKREAIHLAEQFDPNKTYESLLNGVEYRKFYPFTRK